MPGGMDHYVFAISQLAQTTLRSVARAGSH